MYNWSVSGTNEDFDSFLLITEEYIGENQKSESFLFINSWAQISHFGKQSKVTTVLKAAVLIERLPKFLTVFNLVYYFKTTDNI